MRKRSFAVRAGVVGVAAVAMVTLAGPGASAQLPLLPGLGQVRITTTDLGLAPGMSGSYPVAVNEFGQAAGFAFGWNKPQQAVSWRPGRQPVALGVGEVSDINLFGQVVGAARLDAVYSSARLWHNGQTVELTPDKSSYAPSINDSGDIVVVSHRRDTTVAQDRVGLWKWGSYRELPLPHAEGDTVLVDQSAVVNQLGQVATSARIGPSGEAAVFRCTRSACAKLPTPPGLGTLELAVVAMNDRGQILGNGRQYPDSRTYVWSDGKVVDIGGLGGPMTAVFNKGSMNSSGTVVGIAERADHSAAAFSWKNGVMTELPALGGFRNAAYAINDVGDVVGTVQDAPAGNDRAALWRNGKLIQLPGLVPGATSRAMAVNNRGQIVGTSTGADGGDHAVMWTVSTGLL